MARGHDWHGKRFLIISLSVTTLSIIFFFAAQYLSPKIIEGLNASRSLQGDGRMSLWERLTESGGFRVQTVELQIMNEGSDPMLEQELQKRLAGYKGELLWALDVQKMGEWMMNEGYARHVQIRRAYPSRLVVRLFPRTPALLVRSTRAWVVIDNEGYALHVASSIPGAWAYLPVVKGFEIDLGAAESASEINRRIDANREVLRTASSLVRDFQERLNVNIMRMTLKKQDWNEDWWMSLEWKHEGRPVSVTLASKGWESRLDDLQFVLSDLVKKSNAPIAILGQYQGRWFVKKEGENGESLSTHRRH